MDNTSNRTLVCSVLFLDIEEYAKKSVTEQLKLKQRFNALLIRALLQIAPSDRIVLDTGDGAAICFLGSPEVAMFVAMDMRDGIAEENANETLALEVRMGANLGPIRLIKDINGQLNIIGDGINVAQRVMNFASAGTVLVSRSFFEVVSRLSDDYAHILRYEGSHTDKHVREHEVYAVGPSIPHKFVDDHRMDAHDKTTVGDEAASPATQKEARPWFGKKLLAGVSLLALIIVGTAVGLRVGRSSGSGSTESGSQPQLIGVTKTAKALPAKATALLLIVPWGEVYVDGRKRGISPPLKSLSLAPGLHMVEIRNSNLPSHLEKIDVKPGAEIRIKHAF